MDDDALARALPALLRTTWDIDGARITPLGGGMNSATCSVESSDGRSFVAKWSRDVESLEAGSRAATHVSAHGISTGHPVPSNRGSLTATLADGALALLLHVPGRELDGESEHDQQLIGATLATVHAAGAPALGSGPFMNEWLSPTDDILAVATWLPAALAETRCEYGALPPLTWTQLHTDPTPEAFIHDDDTGSTGLIDWAGSCRGPALYDVASAVMYLGGPDHCEQFMATYGESGPLEQTELTHLDAFRRLRWAIQASYFASRILTDDRTGIRDAPMHNQEGLARARRGLEETRPVR